MFSAQVLAGTYSSDSVPSLSIQVESDNAVLKETTSLASAPGPSWIEPSPVDRTLILSSLRSPGALEVHKIEAPYDSWKLVSRVRCKGWNRVVHGSWSHDARTVFAIDYGNSGVRSFAVDEKGNISPDPSSTFSYLETPSAARSDKRHSQQGESHAHQVIQNPNSSYVYVPDLGLDLIHVHKLEGNKLVTHTTVTAPHGCGPRHLAFHPSGRVLYLLAEWGNAVITYEIDPQDGNLNVVSEPVSTLPHGLGISKHRQAAEILVTSDGRYLYASNRYDQALWDTPYGQEEDAERPEEDTIAIYPLSHDHPYVPGKVSHVGSGGHVVRGMALDPTEKFLIAGNKRERSVYLFSRDTSTGDLQISGKLDLAARQGPVCFVWLK